MGKILKYLLKSIRNEGQFTLEAERVLRPSQPSHCKVLTGTAYRALPAYVLHAVQVWLKSDINKGHFTLEAEKVFRPYIS
jgi:hypothetical protein